MCVHTCAAVHGLIWDPSPSGELVTSWFLFAPNTTRTIIQEQTDSVGVAHTYSHKRTLAHTLAHTHTHTHTVLLAHAYTHTHTHICVRIHAAFERMLRVDRFLSIFREANPVEEIRAYHGHQIILPTSIVEDNEDLHDPVPDVWGGTISVAPLSTRINTLSWGEKYQEISEEKENALAQKKKHIVLEDTGASSLQARKSCFKCRKVKCQCRQAPVPQGEKHQSGTSCARCPKW